MPLVIMSVFDQLQFNSVQLGWGALVPQSGRGRVAEVKRQLRCTNIAAAKQLPSSCHGSRSWDGSRCCRSPRRNPAGCSPCTRLHQTAAASVAQCELDLSKIGSLQAACVIQIVAWVDC